MEDRRDRNSFVYILQISYVKIKSAIPGAPSMNKEEVNIYLESKLLLQIGTIDEEGDPNIRPVWFDYDIDREKLLVKLQRRLKT